MDTGSAGHGDGERARAVIEAFFAAIDGQDAAALPTAFASGARIVYDDGVETDVATFVRIVAETTPWRPRTRELSGFDTQRIDDVLVVGFSNDVAFATPEGEVARRFRETWVMVSPREGWKALRIHFSRVRAAAHSEAVDAVEE